MVLKLIESEQEICDKCNINDMRSGECPISQCPYATHAFIHIAPRVSLKFDSTRTQIINASRRSYHSIFVGETTFLLFFTADTLSTSYTPLNSLTGAVNLIACREIL
jgi:hypothetical protein